MARGRRPGCLLGVVALFVTACSSSSPPSAAHGTATTTTTAPTATTATTAATTTAPAIAIPAGARYVALGSSFAAGPGIPTQLPTACARSDHNYAHLVAAQLNLQLVDVSCSGATTANVLTQPQLGNPPQIDAVTPATALITMTVGGNDIEYTATTLVCEQDPNCLTTVDTPAIDAALVALPGRLTQLIAALRARASHAVIVLVTYPQVVPPEGAQCAKLHLTANEAAYIASLGQRLEQVFLAVASSANVLLADPYPSTAGHGPCAASGESWVAGARAPNGFPYHPTAAGHAAMASLVIAAVRRG